jgi:putative membrane protein
MKITSTLRTCFLGVTLLGLPCFAQTGTTGTTGSRTGQTGTMTGQKLIDLPTDEKGILERIRHTNQMEIQLAQLARDKATSQSVKSFAQMMITEHQQVDQKLMTYAQGKKITLGKPKPMNELERKSAAAQEASMEKMKAMSGPLFDVAFMSHMVSGHDMMLAKVITAQQTLKNKQELVTILSELQPKFSQHRDEAYRILGEVKISGMAGVGGAGEQGMEPNHSTMPSPTPGTQQPRNPGTRY